MFPICSVSVKRVGRCIIAAYGTEIICFVFIFLWQVNTQINTRTLVHSITYSWFPIYSGFHEFLVKQFINHSFSLGQFQLLFCYSKISFLFFLVFDGIHVCLLVITEQIYQNETFFNNEEEISHSLRLKQILLDELEQTSFFSVYSFLKGETLYMLWVIIVPLFHNCY